MSEQNKDTAVNTTAQSCFKNWRNIVDNTRISLISPVEAREKMTKRNINPGVYRPRSVSPDVTLLAAQPGQASTVQSPASVVELARALKNDVDLIFYHVHNQIEFSPSYGLQKNSVATLLDGIGNAWDQATLLVDLLRGAGYTANFVSGSLDMTAAEISSWLGTDSSDIAYAANVLYFGGFPITIDFDNDRITFEHIWVKVVIDEVEYILDPSMKTYTNTAGIDLDTAMDYDRGMLLAAADSGATHGTDDLWIQNINYDGLNTELTSYSSNLVNWIKTNNPAASLDDIVGGRKIVEIFEPIRQASHPYETGTLTDWSDIPNGYRTTVRIQYTAAGIDETFYADDLSGRRTTIIFNGSRQPQLRLDGDLVATGTTQSLNSSSLAHITINNPAVTGFFDQSFSLLISAPTSSGSSYYLLGTSFGATRKGMVDYHKQLVAKASANGASEFSDDLLGEQLSTAWHTLNAELVAVADISCRISNCAAIFSQSVGFLTRNSRNNSVTFDVPGGPTAVIAMGPDPDDKRLGCARVISMFSNTLEELSINQVFGTTLGASAGRVLKIANADNTKIYLATKDNWSSHVLPNLTGYTHFPLSDIYNNFLANDGVALVPEEAGQDIGNSFHADAYRAFMPGGSVFGFISHYKGGIGPWGWGPDCKCKDCEDEVADPVGLLSGAYKYRQTDLTVGSSSYPYKLSFDSEYTSADRFKNGPMGLGWSHNWQLGAVKLSEPFRGVGYYSPIESVASIVSIFVSMELASSFEILPIVTSSLTSSWWSEQLTYNVISALTDVGSVEFVKLPDGSFSSTEGEGWTVSESGGEYMVTSPQQIAYSYNADGNLETISFPYGVTITLTYSSAKLATVDNGMGRSLNFTYSGEKLVSVDDNNSRTVEFSYSGNDLTAITDPLGEDVTFDYVSPGLVQSYFMPANPTHPMVVNTYDSLDRVASQIDMYGHWILRVESSKVTVGGSVTEGDVVTLAARVAGLPTGHKSVSYIVEAGDTLADIATGLRNAVNGDSSLSGVGVTATSSGEVISLESETAATYGLHTSIKATVTLTPTATTGDILTVTVFNSALSGGQKSISYTVQSADSTDSIAQGLKSAINGDSSLSAIGITAENFNGPEKGRISLSSTSANSTMYAASSSANATESIFLDSHSSFYFAGWRTEFKNALGYSKVTLYDRHGNTIKEIDELGNETKFVYDGLSRLVDKTMPEGNRTLWTYDSKNNTLTQTQKPKPGSALADIVETFTWDATFNKLEITEDGNDNVTANSYDSTTGQLVTIERPTVGGLVPTVSFSYNARGQLLSRIDESGIQTQFFYNVSNEELLSVIANTNWRATIGGATTVFDQLNITVHDAGLSGGQKMKSYTVVSDDTLNDIAAGLASAINGDSEITDLGVNAKAIGPIISLSTAPGNATIFSQSTSGGATETITLAQGLELTTELGYNAWGDLNSVQDARGNATLNVTDEKRRLTQIEAAAPFEFITNLTYDKNDNRLTIERQTGDVMDPWQVYTATYNLANQLETLTDPDSKTTTRFYNELRQLWKVTDAENRTTKYQYTERGQLETVTNPALVVVQTVTYTDNGAVASVEDASGNFMSVTQDGFDRTDKKIFPDGTFEQNASYDANGNALITLTRAGETIAFEFDPLDRLIEKSPEGMPVVSFEYDLASRLTKMSTPIISGNPASGAWEFSFDTAGRLTSEEAPDGKTVGYELDENGNIVKITYPDAWYVQRFYDELNRLTDIKLNGDTNPAVHFEYDDLSRRTVLEFDNGTQVDYGFELNDDLSSIEMDFNGSSLDFAYGFNGARKVINQTISDARHLWFPTNTNTVPYEPANDLDQYPEVNNVKYSYNDNGCLTSDGVWNFGFDTENHLLSSNNGSVAVSYVYDPKHRQIQKNVDGTKTRFVYSGWQRLADYDGTSDTLQNRFVYGVGFDEPLIKVAAGGALTYMYADRLGSITALANDTGAVTNRYKYSPYGESGGLGGTTFGFTGQRYDAETSLYYFKNRYYSPRLGRFLQPDPIQDRKDQLPVDPNLPDVDDCGCGCNSCDDSGTEMDTNLYTYVLNDPLNWTDPLGLQVAPAPLQCHHCLVHTESRIFLVEILVRDLILMRILTGCRLIQEHMGNVCSLRLLPMHYVWPPLS